MSCDIELKELCQALVAQQFVTVHEAEQALEQFEKLTTPAAVLTVLADLDEARNGMAYRPLMRLKKELERLTAENKRLRSDEAGFRQGSDAEAHAGDEARAEVRRLTADNRALRKLMCAPEEEVRQENRWLKQVIESYALQMAPLEPIPDEPGYSRRLPEYDLPSLRRNAARYLWLKQCDVHEGNRLLIQAPNEIWDQIIDAAISEEGQL